MQSLGVAIVLWAGLGQSPQQFPYDAVVERDNVEVRSGPGQSYYPTSKLKHGNKVRVHKHEPGGWRMIEPPEGSFSLIRAEYVRRLGGRLGEVTQLNAVVRIGSSLVNTAEVEQKRLSTGAKIEIIAEDFVEKQDGTRVKMYKIKPPKGEFRWIDGKYLAAADGRSRRQENREPFGPNGEEYGKTFGSGRSYDGEGSGRDHSRDNGRDNERSRGRGEAPSPRGHGDDWGGDSFGENDRFGDDRDGHRKHGKGGLVERPIVKTSDGKAVRRSMPEDEQLEAERARLQRLDERFREIINHDARQWNFADLERDYRQLQEQVSVPALASQIQIRFGALEHYKELKAEYDDYIHLASERTRRDAQLTGMQTYGGGPGPISEPFASSGDPQPNGPPYAAPQQPAGPQYEAPVPRLGTPIPDPVSAEPAPPLAPPQVPPVRPTLQSQISAPSHHMPVSPQIDPRHPPKFDGAGIVRQAAGMPPGGPRHVLVSPNGRVLAYLQGGPGVNLDQHLNHPMGIYGERSFRQDLQADFLIVNGLTPVRLKP